MSNFGFLKLLEAFRLQDNMNVNGNCESRAPWNDTDN